MENVEKEKEKRKNNKKRKRERFNRLEDKQAIFSSYHLVIKYDKLQLYGATRARTYLNDYKLNVNYPYTSYI